MGAMKYLFFLLALTLIGVNSVQALTGELHLDYPLNETWTNLSDGSYDFNFTFTDPNAITAECTLQLNGANVETVSASNATSIVITSDESKFREGENIWNLSCDDGQGALYTGNMTLYVDRTAPQLFLPLSYMDAVGLNGNGDYRLMNFLLSLNYTDALSPTASCSLYLNGTFNDEVSLFNDSNDNEAFVFPNNGKYYEWWVNCTDLAGNFNSTKVFTVNMVMQGPLAIISPENITYTQLNGIKLVFEHDIPDGYVSSYAYLLSNAAGTWKASNISMEGQYYKNTIESSPELEGVIYNGTLNNTVLNISEVKSDTYNLSLTLTDASGGSKIESVIFSVDVPNNIELTVTPEMHADTAFINVTTETEASECHFSMDGTQNITMENTSGTKWYYYVSALENGNHNIKAWCNISGFMAYDEAELNIASSSITINMQSPLNKTYWKGEAIDMSVYVTPSADSCILYFDSSGPYNANKYTGVIWKYNLTGAPAGSHEVLVRCNDSAGLYSSIEKSFTVMDVECTDNETGLCSGSEYCSNGVCEDLACTGCAQAVNHTCISYECCSSDDCLQSQYCSSHACIPISCDCGEITNHTCNEFDCCSNFDCKMNEECDTEQHRCIKKVLKIIAPESVTAGENLEIVLLDNNGKPVAGAKVKLEYKSGVKESLTTDEFGSAVFIAKESGPVTVTADMAGFDRQTKDIDVKTGFDITAFVILLLVIIGGGTGIFYWKNLPDISLKKAVNGQDVILRVKNRSGDYIENALILDTVPRGAFISCGLSPSMEDVGNETHLTWYASLNKDEEIMINYQATATSEYFIVKVGDDEYQSGSNPFKVLKAAIEDILHKDQQPDYESY